MTRRKLPPNVETEPGESQDERWTLHERLVAWRMFVEHTKGDGMWGVMSRLAKRSIKSCKAEMWKIHAANPGGPIYWDKAGRLDVAMTLPSREGKHWTEHENAIVDAALKAGIPFHRVSVLLGRSEEAVEKQLAKRRKENRPKMLDLLEQKQETNHDPDREARSHPLFPAFEEWGGHNGVETDPSDSDCFVEDWMPHWQCFLAGVNAADKFPRVKE